MWHRYPELHRAAAPGLGTDGKYSPMWGRLWCTPNSFASDPSRVPPAWACGARAPIRVPDPVEGRPAPLGVAPRHTRASLHGRNDHRVVRSPVVVLGPPGVGFASGRGPRSRPGARRRAPARWVGRGGAIVVPVHHRRTLFLCYAASVGALKAKPPTESERPRQ